MLEIRNLPWIRICCAELEFELVFNFDFQDRVNDSFDVTKCLQQIEKPDLLHMCALWNEWPSNIKAMIYLQIYPHYTYSYYISYICSFYTICSVYCIAQKDPLFFTLHMWYESLHILYCAGVTTARNYVYSRSELPGGVMCTVEPNSAALCEQ